LQKGAIEEAEKWQRVCEGLEAKLAVQQVSSVYSAEAASKTAASAALKTSKPEREATRHVASVEEGDTSPATPSAAGTAAAKSTSPSRPTANARGRSPS